MPFPLPLGRLAMVFTRFAATAKSLARPMDFTFCFALRFAHAQVVKLVDTLSSGGSA